MEHGMEAGAWTAQRERFRALHESGHFVIPNPWDVGSARLLAASGFEALATTSSGLAASRGLPDQEVGRDDLVAHVAAIASSVSLPVSVDSEDGFPDAPGGVAETGRLLAAAGASGFSVEDYDPAVDEIIPIELAVQRVKAAAEVATEHGMVLTARAENFIRHNPNLDDTIQRLSAFKAAGAGCVYAPGLRDLDDIGRVVTEVGGPLNVLLYPDGPSVPQLAAVGVRRMSTGGTLAKTAYAALLNGAGELLHAGTSAYSADDPSWADLWNRFRG